MKFIAPLEIASKIMTLIVEAEKELILVSPYVKINDWDKMKKSLSKAVNKGVKISFITRQNATNDLTPLKALNIQPILIKDLHAKVYINDKYAIVTSQNITHYSDINSIDIAYQTEDEKERTQLIDFVKNYIKNIEPAHKNILNIVENKNYENLFPITDWQLEKLTSHFIAKYHNVKFVSTFSYIFSGHLLPFADVMMSTQYTIKIKKSYQNCDKLIEEISKIKFDFKNNLRIDLRTSHEKFYYLEFVPTQKMNFNNLVLDYQMITENILNAPYIKDISFEIEKRINEANTY